VHQISFQYVHPVQTKWTEIVNYWNFSKSKGHNSGKNGSIVPKIELGLDILTINLYTKFHFNMYNHCKRKWTKTSNYWNFSKSKGYNSGKNGSIVPKRELDLDILTINLYTKFYFNMCNQCKENERKLQIIGIFRSPGTITLAKMARSYPNRTWPRYS
jgi:hypothetical protein